MTDNDPILDYEEDEEPEQQTNGDTGSDKKVMKGNYVSIHSSGFRDFLLKPELLRAIVDCGFEHPSEGTEEISYVFGMLPYYGWCAFLRDFTCAIFSL